MAGPHRGRAICASSPFAPGIVYGTYRYRVRYGADEHSGLSERLFVKTPKGWKIAVTSAFDAPPGTPPPPRAFVGRDARRRHRELRRCPGRGRPRAGRQDRLRRARAVLPVPAGVDVDDVRGDVDHARPRSTRTSTSRRPAGPTAGPTRSTSAPTHPYEKTEADLQHPSRALRPLLPLLRRDRGLRRRRLSLDARPAAPRRERHARAARRARPGRSSRRSTTG